MGYSVTSAAQLEDKLCVAIEASAASLASLQRQITSLAQVTLQNRRALDLLTAEKGGKPPQKAKYRSFVSKLVASYAYLANPIITPVIVICLLLLMAPFLLRFLQTCMREIGRVAINQMLLHPFIRLSVEAPAN
ncbi:provirus ancestral Env polyprotein [Plecturocebus cupreus]